MIQVIGIDVGGANVKVVAREDVFIYYCPLWKGAPLKELLLKFQGEGNAAAVVMSGELADCFANKMEGITFITGVVQEVFPQARFYGNDAAFHGAACPELAAANWLASADYLRGEYPDAVFVDIGSTTTDIIPLRDFSLLKGLNDLQRLQKGYLIYTGMQRTSIPTLIRTARIGGILTPVSTEYFACSADAHLVLGHIDTSSYTIEAPDSGKRNIEGALRRLARVVCADLEEIGESGAREIAETFWKVQEELISTGISAVCRKTGTDEVIFAGTGSRLFAKKFGGTNLSGALGPVVDALPAFAVQEVAIRDHISFQ